MWLMREKSHLDHVLSADEQKQNCVNECQDLQGKLLRDPYIRFKVTEGEIIQGGT
jgi:hypothetical protein